MIPLRINGGITDCGEWGCVTQGKIYTNIPRRDLQKKIENSISAIGVLKSDEFVSLSPPNCSLADFFYSSLAKKEQKERPRNVDFNFVHAFAHFGHGFE